MSLLIFLVDQLITISEFLFSQTSNVQNVISLDVSDSAETKPKEIYKWLALEILRENMHFGLELKQ